VASAPGLLKKLQQLGARTLAPGFFFLAPSKTPAGNQGAQSVADARRRRQLRVPLQADEGPQESLPRSVPAGGGNVIGPSRVRRTKGLAVPAGAGARRGRSSKSMAGKRRAEQRRALWAPLGGLEQCQGCFSWLLWP